MPTFDAGSVESRLYLDRSPFVRSLGIARSMAQAFESGDFEATLGAKLSELRDDLRNGKQELGEFAREKAEATLRANDRPARRTLDGFDEVMRRYGRSWGQQGIRARVTADIQRATRSLRLLERQLEHVTDEDHRIRIEAEITRTRQRLEGLDRLAKGLGMSSPTISVGLRGRAATMAGMLGLQRLADRLDGYNIRFKADIDQSLSNALPSVLGALEMQVMRYRTVVAAISAITMPMFYASLGAMPAVLSAAAAGVGSLATAVGKGGAGAAAGLTGALGLGGAALYAYGRAVSGTIRYVGDLTDTIKGQMDQVKDSNKVLDEAKARLERVAMQSDEYASAKRRLTAQEKRAKNSIKEAEDAVESARKALKKAEPGTEEYAKAKRKLELAEKTLEQTTKRGSSALAEHREALEKAIPNSEAYRRAQKGVALAQENARYEQARLNALYDIATPRVMRLQRRVNDARLGMLRFGGDIMNEVAPAILTTMNRFDKFSDSVKKGSLDMIRDMTDVAQSFIRAGSRGQNLENITTILKGVKSAGVPAFQAAGNAALLFLDIIAPVVPKSLSILRNIRDITRAGREWASSARGQRSIARTWDELFEKGDQLWRITKNLGAGLWGVLDALDQSGTGDWLLNHTERLSKRLAELTSRTGSWHKNIKEFSRDARPILAAAGSLAKEAAKQFFRVADEVITFRKEGSKLTVLEDIFKSIEDSLKPLADFLLYEFKEIGPLIGPFIEELSDWFSTMAKSQPEMKFFIRFLTDMLELFNSLPEDTQRNISRIIAYAAALRSLTGGGGSGLLAGVSSGLVQLAGNYFLLGGRVSDVTRKLRNFYRMLRRQPPIPSPVTAPAAPAPVPSPAGPMRGGPGRVGTPPVITPQMNTSRSLAKRLGEKLVAFKNAVLRFAGPTIAIGIVLTFDYGGYRKAYRESRNAGKSIPVAWSDGMMEGLKGVPLLGPIMSQLDKWIEDVKPGGKYHGVLGKWGLRQAGFSEEEAEKIQKEKGPIGTIVAFQSRVLMNFAKKLAPGGKWHHLLPKWLQREKNGADEKNKNLKWGSVGTFIWNAIKGAIPIFALGARLAEVLGQGKKRGTKKNNELNWRSIGSGIWNAIKRAIPLFALGARLAEMLGGGKKRAKDKNDGLKWGTVGSAIWNAIKRAVPIFALGARLAEMLGGGKQRAKKKNDDLKWGSVGTFIWNAIKKAVPLLQLGARLSEMLGGGKRRAKKKNDDLKWPSIGEFIWNKIKREIPVLGLGIRLAEMLGKGKEKARSKNDGLKWGTIGEFAFNKIKNAVPLLGLGARLAEMLGNGKNRAKEKNDGLKWGGIGESIVSGIRKGITGNWNIGSVLVELAKAAWTRVKNFFRSKSPSRLFAELGHTLPQGLAAGIQEQASRAVNAAMDMAKRVSDAASVNAKAKATIDVEAMLGKYTSGLRRPPSLPPSTRPRVGAAKSSLRPRPQIRTLGGTSPSSTRSAGTDAVQSAQYMAERMAAVFREEMSKLRAENRSISEEQAVAMVRAAFAASMSELGRYIDDVNLQKNVKAAVAGMPNVKAPLGGRK